MFNIGMKQMNQRLREAEAEIRKPSNRGTCFYCGAQIGSVHGGMEAVAFEICDKDSPDAVEIVEFVGGEIVYGHHACYRCMYLPKEERGKTPEAAQAAWEKAYSTGGQK